MCMHIIKNHKKTSKKAFFVYFILLLFSPYINIIMFKWGVYLMHTYVYHMKKKIKINKYIYLKSVLK